MQVGKLNPQYVSGTSKGKLNFPGFQEILDFTSAGSESSVSVTVDGDTDKEYKVLIRSFSADATSIRLNADVGNNYGDQYLINSSGTITSGRQVLSVFRLGPPTNGLSTFTLLTPTGLAKTGLSDINSYTSGTTIGYFYVQGAVWNNTENVTSITVLPESGTFTSGTRITVFARRSQ